MCVFTVASDSTRSPGDLPVGPACRDQAEDLPFPFGQHVEHLVGSRAGARLLWQVRGERVEQPAGHARGDQGVTGRNGADPGSAAGTPLLASVRSMAG